MGSKQLTLAEEFLLMTLDDKTGMLMDSISPFKYHIAISASLLMELSLQGRIDLDANELFVISDLQTEDILLNKPLEDIVRNVSNLSASKWMHRFAKDGDQWISLVIERLIQRGILHSVEKRLLWVFKTRSYSPESGVEQMEVKQRIMLLIGNHDIPDPKDALLVGLLNAVGIFEQMLKQTELADAQIRIDQIVNLEHINRSLLKSIEEASDIILQHVRSYQMY
jgi:hypothetical protein